MSTKCEKVCLSKANGSRRLLTLEQSLYTQLFAENRPTSQSRPSKLPLKVYYWEQIWRKLTQHSLKSLIFGKNIHSIQKLIPSTSFGGLLIHVSSASDTSQKQRGVWSYKCVVYLRPLTSNHVTLPLAVPITSRRLRKCSVVYSYMNVLSLVRVQLNTINIY